MLIKKIVDKVCKKFINIFKKKKLQKKIFNKKLSKKKS